MTLTEMLDTLREPSDETWDALTAWLDGLDDQALSEALPALRERLQDWPDHIQRSATPQWAEQDRTQLLSLCQAPGGLILEVKGGGGGKPEGYARELIDPERLDEAAIMLLDSVFELSGDCGSSIRAQAFSYGQVVGPSVDLAPHIEARYEPTATSFRLDAIPPKIREELQRHYQACVERNPDGEHDESLVPLELRWDPKQLNWPTMGSAGDWFFLDCVRIYAGDSVVYDDADSVHYPTREYWPDLLEVPEGPPGEDAPSSTIDMESALARLFGSRGLDLDLDDEADEDEHEHEHEHEGEARGPKSDAPFQDPPADEPPSIAKMLGAQGLGELLTGLLQVLEHFGVWTPTSFDDAYARVLYELEMLPNPGGRAKRICETLTDFGRLEGPAVETVSGLLVCHAFELDLFRTQLQRLVHSEQLQLREGAAAEATEALVPLCAWAVSSHRKPARARGALADALLEHPLVDDLFCEDAALLPHLPG